MVLSNERGQSRCHLAGEKELFGSLVYMHLLNSITAGKFGVVGKVLDLQSTGGFDWGSNPVGPNFFFLGKKGKKSRVASLPFLFPTKSCQIVDSLSPASHLK